MSGANVVEDANINDSGELILTMSNGDEINAGSVTKPTPTIQDVYIEDARIKIQYSDGTVKDGGSTTELGIKDVDKVYLDGYDVYADYLDGTSEKIGNVFFEANSEIFTTYMNRDDGYMYGIRYNGDIETIGDLEKYVGDKFSENIIQITSNDLEEVILHMSDGGEYNIGKIYYKDYSVDSSLKEISNVWVDPYTSTLKVTYSDGSVDDAGPTSYTNINGKPIVLGNAFINEIGHLNLEVLKVDDTGSFVMKEEPVSNPDGTVTYEEVFDTRLIDAGLVKGFDGEDGTVYESVYVSSDGLLTFNTADGNSQIAGFLTDRSVIDAYINTDGILVLKLSNGDEIETSNVLGKDGMDGENIASASIDADGELWLHFEDNTIPDIPAGKVDYPVEVSMDNDSDGNIIFTMSNGDVFNVGRIEGVDSKYITDIENRSDGIYVKYSDNAGEWFNIGNLNIYPESAQVLSDGKLELSFSNGTSVVTDERIRGLDGDTIKSMYFEGNDLIVSRTIDNRETIIEERFENVKGVGIKNIQYDPDNHSIVFTNDLDVNTVVLLPELKDGIGVANVVKDGKDLIFKMDDTTEHVLEDAIGQGIDFVSYDGDKLSFENTVTGDIYNIETIHGSDGNSIEETIVGDDHITFKFTDSVDVKVDIPKGNMHEKTVEDITRQTIDGENFIIVSFVEAEFDNIIIPVPLPQDGDDIEEAYVNADDDLVFTITGKSEPVVFPVIKGRDGNDVEDVDYDNDTNELILITNNGEFKTELPEFNDGLGITSITYDTENLNFNLDNGTTSSIPLPKGEDGVGVQNVQYFDDKLHFILTDGNTRSFPIPKGRDGDSVTDVQYISESQDVVIKVENQSDTVIPFRTGIDGKTITDIYLNGRDLVIETDVLDSDGNPIVLTHEMLLGKDAVDGVSVEGFTVEGSDLLVNMDDGTSKTIVGAGKYVSNIEYKNEKLYFTYTNGDVDITDPIRGEDGIGNGITDIKIVDNVLQIEVSDNKGVIANLNHDLSSITVDKVEINESGELIVYYKDTTTKNLGKVQGTRQKWMKSASISSNDILTVVLTDGINDSLNILGNIKGAEGVHATDIDIDKKTGDFNMTFSDSTSMLIGNIKDDKTLSTWALSSTPYPKDVVVMHNESMFLSLIDNNSHEPPSDNWKEFALSNNFVEVLKPIIISPKDTELTTKRVTLIGKPYNGYNSKRLYREFVILDGSDNIIFEGTRNADSITIPSDISLSFNTNYKWKIRDVSLTGFVSAWSDEAVFSVVDSLYSPTISTTGNTEEMILIPLFKIDPVYSATTAEIVTLERSSWEIKNTDTDTIVFEDTIIGDIYSLQVPLGVLENNTNYSVKALVKSAESISDWSNIIAFKTENISVNDQTSYVKKPLVAYSGTDPLDIDLGNPKFISSTIERGSLISSNEFLDITPKHTTSDWEIVDATTGNTVVTFYDTYEKYEICVVENYIPNNEYRIRVRYHTQYAGTSEWSDWLSFMAKKSIEKPVLTIDSTSDANNFIPDDYVYISTYSGNGAPHVRTEIKVTDASSGEFLYDNRNFEYSIVDKFKLLIPEWLKNTTLNVQVRQHSDIIISEWSDPLTIVPKSNTHSEYYIYTSNRGNLFYQPPSLPSSTETQRNVSVLAFNELNKPYYIRDFSFSETVFTSSISTVQQNYSYCGLRKINDDIWIYLGNGFGRSASTRIGYYNSSRIMNRTWHQIISMSDKEKQPEVLSTLNAIKEKSIPNKNLHCFINLDDRNGYQQLTYIDYSNPASLTRKRSTINGTLAYVDDEGNYISYTIILDTYTLVLNKYNKDDQLLDTLNISLNTNIYKDNLEDTTVLIEVIDGEMIIAVVVKLENSIFLFKTSDFSNYVSNDILISNFTGSNLDSIYVFTSRLFSNKVDNKMLIGGHAGGSSQKFVLTIDKTLNWVNFGSGIQFNDDSFNIISGTNTHEYNDLFRDVFTYIDETENELVLPYYSTKQLASGDNYMQFNELRLNYNTLTFREIIGIKENTLFNYSMHDFYTDSGYSTYQSSHINDVYRTMTYIRGRK